MSCFDQIGAALSAVKDFSEWVSYVIVIVGGLWAVLTYKQSVESQRTRWLESLWEKCYVGSAFLNARRALVWQEKKLETLVMEAEKESGNDADANLMVEIDNYLNFFEFIALLLERGEITPQNVNDMFGSSLRLLSEAPDMAEYLNYAKYQRLPALLRQINPQFPTAAASDVKWPSPR